jgi:hypothetical protein
MSPNEAREEASSMKPNHATPPVQRASADEFFLLVARWKAEGRPMPRLVRATARGEVLWQAVDAPPSPPRRRCRRRSRSSPA